MLKAIAGTLIILGMLACSGAEAKPDPVQQYAECMADPSKPMHQLFGSPTVVEARITLDRELATGEQTLAEIEALLPQVCGE